MNGAPPSIPLSQAQSPCFVGVDVGGTNIKLGLVDNLGRTIARQTIATQQQDGPQAAVERMAAAVRQIVQQAGGSLDDIPAVGLATPGTMDIPAGMLLQPHNLPAWWGFPIREKLSAACGRPVVFANDANAAAFGESWVGSGQGFSSIVLLTLGTGVGGGIIIGDLSVDGQHSHGGECGHVILDYHDTARLCPCGQRGHLEAYASAQAVVQRTQEALEAGRPSSLRQRLAGGQVLTPKMVAEEAERNDELALELVLETARYLGIGVVTLMHTIDPGAVILGGAMTFGGASSPLGQRFLERVRQEVRRRAFPVLADRTSVVFAALGSDAGYIGAAGIARAAHHAAPGGSAA
jgi:glucokinase